ncbi:MAG: Ig-like domain-containing protein, partial [Thermoplasmata archaeon]
DPQTSVDGTVKWVTVTDRIYEGSNIPTENVTIATVSSPGKTFIDNGRDVDMFSSHQEAFYEYGAEIFPPEIYMVRVNGSVEIFVTAGTPVELTAVVDDSNGGNSNIASANYTRGAKTWPSGSMVALDGVFDSPIEGVWAMIDTTGWSPGRYEMWVYACDGSFCNETGDFAVINIVGDIWPPEIQNALVDGQPSQTVAAGTIVTLTATISDSLRGGSTINFANYTFGPMNWSSSVSMAPSDGGFDTSIEDVEATVNTAGWGCAVYNLYVYGSDLVGNGNATSTAYATITINVCDTLPPEVSAVAIDGQPGGATYPLSSLPPTIALTATVDDSSTGNSNIGGANYTTTVDGWPGTAMTATDGNLDSPTEGVQAVMATPSAPGSYSYFIYAWDDLTLPNYNNSAPGARLDILDDLAPRTENVLLDGAISLTINQGDPVDLTATIYDTFTGDMAIQSANYTLGAENWPGTQMNAADGAFDSSTEDVTLTLDTSAFPAGTHSVCVYGVDFGNNGNETCDNFATLTVIIPDLNPPIVSQVLANGSATFSVPQGGIVNLTASVDDTTTGDSEIVAANYTDGPGNWTSSTPMVALDGGYDSPQETVKADIDTATWTLGTHQLCVYARDASGNNNTSTQCAEINIIGMGVPPTASGSPTGVDVPLTTNITVIFSKPMNTDITNTSFTVTDFQSIWDHQDGLVTWTDGDTKMTFDPGFVLGSNTGYLVIIDGSVAEDVAGRLLDGNDDGIEGDNYTFWFRTEVYIPPDDDPPGATSPISGETDVPISTRVIAVGFDEEMDEDSVGVSINPETEIEDTSWSGNTLYIILSENLEPNTEYTIVISGATDANGNPIDVDGDGIPDPGTDLTFTFDTSSGPEAPAPAGFDMGWIVVIILAIVVVLLLLLLIKKPKPEVLKPLEEGEAIALMEEEEKELLEEV